MSTALITGASRGLGARAAHRLADQGVTVLAGAREPSALAARLREDSGTSGLDIRALALDVNDDASVEAAVKEVEETVGPLDVLVNNAGIHGSRASAAEIGPDDVRSVYETNVFAPVRVTRAFLPLLRRGEHPRLVMVSSGLGSFGLNTADPLTASIGFLPYPSSKAALNMLTLQYAKGLPDVLVTAVDPGYTATDFNDHSGFQSVEEGTDAIVTAALDTSGPTGRFVDREGVMPW